MCKEIQIYGIRYVYMESDTDMCNEIKVYVHLDTDIYNSIQIYQFTPSKRSERIRTRSFRAKRLGHKRRAINVDIGR